MARQFINVRFFFVAAGFGLAVLVGLFFSAQTSGQTSSGQTSKFTQPVYRVAAQPAAQAATLNTGSTSTGVRVTGAQAAAGSTPAVQPAAATLPADSPFDISAQPGEHPLAPAIRICKASADHIDQNIKDYSCTLVKRERLPTEVAVGEPQIIDMRIRHEPFSVHMSFIQPHAGRKVVWVKGANEDKLTVREGGILGLVKVDFLPESATAMNGQKYPIYKIGIRNLLGELIKNFEADTKYTESDVKINPKAEFNKRPATLIQVSHPVPRQNFRSHVARIYFDNEHKVPIYYDAFMWPAKDGEQPPLEESFAYTNLKVNNGFTGRKFDKENADNFR